MVSRGIARNFSTGVGGRIILTTGEQGVGFWGTGSLHAGVLPQLPQRAWGHSWCFICSPSPPTPSDMFLGTRLHCPQQSLGGGFLLTPLPHRYTMGIGIPRDAPLLPPSYTTVVSSVKNLLNPRHCNSAAGNAPFFCKWFSLACSSLVTKAMLRLHAADPRALLVLHPPAK